MQRLDALEWRVESGRPALTVVDGVSGDETCGWLEARRPELVEALSEHGALLLRGLLVHDVDAFARVRDVLIPEATPYREKATPRRDFGDGVFSSTELPPSQPIEMHNENSYTLTFPGLLLFGCLVAPAQGGATPVADCRAVLRSLPPRLRDKMRAVGWQLTRCYSEHISTDWRTAFATDDRERVAAYCDENLIAHAWQDDGHLRTSQIRPGIITHPVTGDEVWFNHMAFWNEQALDEELREVLVDEFGPDGLPFNTAFGDGTKLSDQDLAVIRQAYQAATLREAWQPGDLLLVDNIRCAHGRDSFRGDRKIVVAMGQPVALGDCRPTVPAAAAFAGP